jgi:hypothetical protein
MFRRISTENLRHSLPTSVQTENNRIQEKCICNVNVKGKPSEIVIKSTLVSVSMTTWRRTDVTLQTAYSICYVGLCLLCIKSIKVTHNEEGQNSSSHSEKLKIVVFWDVSPCSVVDTDQRLVMIALMMEAVSNSETSVKIYQTILRIFSENSHLHNEELRMFHLRKHWIDFDQIRVLITS